MSRRTTYVLAVILVVLLAGSYAFSKRQQASTPSLSPTTGPWLQLTNGQIKTISMVDTAKGQKLELARKSDTEWMVQSPTAGAADPQQIYAWLGQWQYLYAQHTITPTSGLADYGLAEPALVITFTIQVSNSIKTAIIHVGKLVQVSSGYYARQVGSDQVAVIGLTAVDETRNLINAPPLLPITLPQPELVPQLPVATTPSPTP